MIPGYAGVGYGVPLFLGPRLARVGRREAVTDALGLPIPPEDTVLAH